MKAAFFGGVAQLARRPPVVFVKLSKSNGTVSSALGTEVTHLGEPGSFMPVLQEKPRVLLVVRYHRKDDVRSFRDLENKCDVTYLCHIKKPSKEIKLTSARGVYWSSYPNAQGIIEGIRPDVIVFYSLSSMLAISLNIVAKRNGIPTVYLQHGMQHDYATYRQLYLRAKETSSNLSSEILRGDADSFSTMKFVARSLSLLDTFWLPHIAAYSLVLRIVGGEFGYMIARKYCGARFLRADYYLLFSLGTSMLMRELDKPSRRQIRYLGFRGVEKNTTRDEPEEPYYILIDSPMTDLPHVPRHGRLMSVEQKANVYKVLNEFAVSKGARLVVKLHPMDYWTNWSELTNGLNVNWVRDADVAQLILNSEGCFCGTSTLLIPALYYTRVCYLNYMNTKIARDLHCQGMIHMVDPFRFAPDDISFPSMEKIKTTFVKWKDDYVGDVDNGFEKNLTCTIKDIVVQNAAGEKGISEKRWCL